MAGGLPAARVERSRHSAHPKPREPTKLRVILLLSFTAKTAEMELARLQWLIEPLHQNLFGFTRDVSLTDSIFGLLAQVNHCPILVIFLDLEKAFKLASPHAILTTLIGKGVRRRLLAWLREYLLHRRARVKF